MFEMVEQKTEDFYCRTVPERLSHHLALGSTTFFTTDLERLRLGVAEDDTHDTILPAIDAHHKLTNLTILHSTIAYISLKWERLRRYRMCKLIPVEPVWMCLPLVKKNILRKSEAKCWWDICAVSSFYLKILDMNRYESNRIIEDFLDRRYPEKNYRRKE